jgi:hypothetical protein
LNIDINFILYGRLRGSPGSAALRTLFLPALRKWKRHAGNGHIFIDDLNDDKISAPYNYGVRLAADLENSAGRTFWRIKIPSARDCGHVCPPPCT